MLQKCTRYMAGRVSCYSARVHPPPAGLEQLPPLASLSSLRMLSSQLGDRGCRHLAPALPALQELWLGAKGVGDRGLRALCTTLPQVCAPPAVWADPCESLV